jgi:hypothetical protein
MKGTANGERGTANGERRTSNAEHRTANGEPGTLPPLGRRDLNRLLKLAGRALLCPSPGGRPLPERRFRKVMAAMTPAARREWRKSARLIDHVLALALARRRR